MPGASGRGLSDLHSRSRRAGHLRARVSRRTHYGRATQALPDGSAGAGPFELSASVADAGLLAVSDRQHGARADYRDLSGAADEVSGKSRHREDGRAQGLVLLWRRRYGRAGITRPDRPRPAREALYTDIDRKRGGKGKSRSRR